MRLINEGLNPKGSLSGLINIEGLIFNCSAASKTCHVHEQTAESVIPYHTYFNQGVVYAT